MIPQITKALAKGFSASQIVNLLIRKFPNQKDAIQKSLAAGFTADQILRFFSRNSNQKLEQPKNDEISTSYSKMRDTDISRRGQNENTGLAALAVPFSAQAGLSALSSMNSPNTAMAMQHAMPSNPAALLTGTPQKLLPTPTLNNPPPNTNPVNPSPITPPIVPGANLTQNQTPIPQEINAAPNSSSMPSKPASPSILQEMGLEKQVQNMLAGNVLPEDIASVLESHLLTPGQKKWLKEQTDEPLGSIIEKFSQNQPQISENSPETNEVKAAEPIEKTDIPLDIDAKSAQSAAEREDEVSFEDALHMWRDDLINKKILPSKNKTDVMRRNKNGEITYAIKSEYRNKDEAKKEIDYLEKAYEKNMPDYVKEQISDIKKLIDEDEKIQKNQTVAAPQGIGEVKEIRNGKALVEIDGKKHVVDEEDLEAESPEIIEEVQKILKIPEVDKSSIVSLFTFDPDERKMYIQFHNGETYKYLDVEPEKVMNIANKMGIPVTKGKNIFGAWSPQDKKSLGATLIKEIINDPKYKKPKKGQPANPNYVQLETLYDYWEKLRKKPKQKRF